MAGIYDTHTHLNDDLYMEMDITPLDLVKNAQLAGVTILNVVGYDLESSKLALRYANEHPNVYAAIGIHPNEAQYFTKEAVESIEEMSTASSVVAIGEIGLDYTKGRKYQGQQIAIFEAQIKIALKHQLPIMVHVKDEPGKQDAYRDVLKILDSAGVVYAVIHAYEGNWLFAKEFLNRGYYLSFSGIITYPENQELEEVVRKANINQLLIETDAPYAPPVPFQGKINYPSLAPIIVQKIASLKKLDPDDVASATRVNGQKVFQLK